MWRRRRLLPILFGLAIILLLGWLRVSDPYLVHALRDATFDGYQRVAPRPSGDYPVKIVDIDEASLAEIGQWPWPRNTMADLATRLTQLGAAAVAFDVLFPEPDRMSPVRIAEAMRAELPPALFANAEQVPLPDFDREFADALAASPSILGFGVTPTPGALPDQAKAGFAIVGPNQNATVPSMTGSTTPLPILVEAAKGLGNISLQPGGDVGTIRLLPLLWSNGSSLFPSLSIETLRVALGAGAIVVFTDQTGFGAVQSVRIGDFEVPTTPNGSLWLYYQERPENLYIPARDVLGPDWMELGPDIAGNIILIGTSATGLLDIRGTPLGTNMPGVEIHAQALQQILSGTYLERGDWVSGLELLAFAVISLVILGATLVLGPLFCLLLGGVLGLIVAGGSWLAFTRAGILIDPSFPLLGGFIVYSAMIFFRFVITDSDKRKIRNAFGYYVAPTLLAEIERSSAGLRLGGETRELSIMFSDIKDFTTLSEGFEPTKLVALLNTLFGALGAQITDELGTIDKFIGDAVMAFWNAPVAVERHPLRACTAALGMRRTLRDLNANDAFRLKAGGHAMKEIAIRIGISTGPALVGNMGLETRFDYSCVGDTVNVASRVEAACKTVGYDIVVVEATRAAAAEFAFLEAGSISLKGKSRREPIHILVGDAALAQSAEFKALKEAHARLLGVLQSGAEGDEAIDGCIALIRFPDPMLKNFYNTMRRRRGDYAAEVIPELVAAGHGHA